MNRRDRVGLAFAAAVVLVAAPARGEAPSKMYDTFHAFLEQRLHKTPYGLEQWIEAWTIQADDRNGYLEAVDGGDLEPEEQHYVLALWRKAGGAGAVYGFTQGTERCVSEGSFWAQEQGKWRKLEGLAPVRLQDFWPDGKPLPPGSEELAALDLRLPRKGTTIVVGLKARCEGEKNPLDLEAFERWAAKAKYATIELLWDARVGRFTLGKKTPTAGK